MLITLDVGNSHTVFGIYAGERLTHHWRIQTSERTTDEHGAILSTLMQGGWNRVPVQPEGVAISCSVPPLNQAMEQLSVRYFQCAPLMVGPGIKTGMPILYENPKEVGADRIVNAVAAFDKCRERMHRRRFRHRDHVRLRDRPRRVRRRRRSRPASASRWTR